MPVARVTAAIAVLLALAMPPRIAGAAEGSPHHMTKADGELDREKCAVCHTPDMGLLLGTKLDTCTLCHAVASHSGSAEHVRVEPAAVAAALAGRAKDAVALPLSEDGHIWCGTCHLYHDPKVMGEAWLAHGWVPPDSGLPGAVRDGVLIRWARLAEVHGEATKGGSFATQGTRQLRLPVEDGTLCRQCHAEYGGKKP